jgi:bifunctional non-homologous end joining protein LigD
MDADGAFWVEPVVVVEARTLELTREGRLRQPAYLGIRTDLTASGLLGQWKQGEAP